MRLLRYFCGPTGSRSLQLQYTSAVFSRQSRSNTSQRSSTPPAQAKQFACLGPQLSLRSICGPTGSRTPTCSMPWNRSTAILWARLTALSYQTLLYSQFAASLPSARQYCIGLSHVMCSLGACYLSEFFAKLKETSCSREPAPATARI